MHLQSVCVKCYCILLLPTRFGLFCAIREKSNARENIYTALLYITRNGCSCCVNIVPDYIYTVRMLIKKHRELQCVQLFYYVMYI